jgi:hypothetical protein
MSSLNYLIFAFYIGFTSIGPESNHLVRLENKMVEFEITKNLQSLADVVEVYVPEDQI